MKKTYIIPQTFQVRIEAANSMMTLSMTGQAARQDSEVLVKEQTDFSQPSYNVWEDDWSK